MLLNIMSSPEVERFEVTEEDLQNEFNPNRPQFRQTKHRATYGNFSCNIPLVLYFLCIALRLEFMSIVCQVFGLMKTVTMRGQASGRSPVVGIFLLLLALSAEASKWGTK